MPWRSPSPLCSPQRSVDVAAPEGAQAGTGPVTLVFSAESESSSAGIVGVQTQLPRGIAPQDVALAGGPAGWVLTPITDGYEIAGPDIGLSVGAEYSVTVARLPADSTELAFPTLQRSSDGREDAWIQPITDAVPTPDQPAPCSPSPPTSWRRPWRHGAARHRLPRTVPAPPPNRRLRPSPLPRESNAGTVALVTGVLVVAAIGGAAWVWRAGRAR